MPNNLAPIQIPSSMPRSGRARRFLFAILVLSLTLSTVVPVAGSYKILALEIVHGSPPLTLNARDGSVRVQWTGDGLATAAEDDGFLLTPQPYGGHMLPMQTFAVGVENGVLPAAATSVLADIPWYGELEVDFDQKPPVLDWVPLAQNGGAQSLPLPSEPLFLLRSGRARGRTVAVFAFSELYRDKTGNLRRVVSYNGTLAGASLLTELEDVDAATAAGNGDDVLRGVIADGVPSAHWLSRGRAVKAFAEHEGIQEIGAGELAEAGIANPSVNGLRAFLRGVEVPLHVLDYDNNGRLDGDDSIRFYAPAPGDQWNVKDVYWIVHGSTAGKRIAARVAVPVNAPVRTVGIAAGTWSDNRRYESELAGTDGDNWFSAELAEPATETSLSEVIMDLSPPLPLAVGSSLSTTLILDGTAVDAREDMSDPPLIPHILQFQGGTVYHTDGAEDWVVDFTSDTSREFERAVTVSGTASQLTFRVEKSQYPTRIFVDQLVWRQPVQLSFAGKGAIFSGVEGRWRYRLREVPDDAWIYDITDPTQPMNLGDTSGAIHEFEDGPEVHRYLLAAEGTVFHPSLEEHVPISVSTLEAADIVYVTPSQFQEALAPLIAQRINSGLTVESVDVQELYDGWGYGFVDPDAIRTFLRYAVGTWKTAPVAAVLVGDGTHDPKDYTGFGNPNHIPPYLADVDPWLGVTACENCYAQLDGDDPLTESAFLIDIVVGRLPVSTEEQLHAVVDKIVRYEQAENDQAPWRNISVQLADNWIHEGGWKDSAGNFAQYIERLAELAPPGVRYERLYYSPYVEPDLLDQESRAWLARTQQWTVSDEEAARSGARSLLSHGAGLVTYTGHANHWVWARLGEIAGYDNRLFGLWDVSSLVNYDELFIGLSMTCLSAEFSEPAEYPMTLDEHLVLHPGGGAVAVWGPSGLSVSHGHDALQIGFYGALWDESTAPGEANIGSLIRAGYENVVLNSTCCQDVTKTFLLLGDPMMPARVRPLEQLILPFVPMEGQVESRVRLWTPLLQK